MGLSSARLQRWHSRHNAPVRSADSLTVSISILVVTIKRDIYNRHGEGGQRSLFCK